MALDAQDTMEQKQLVLPDLQIYSTLNGEITPFWREKYEKDAKKYWDVFYKRHQDRFFKDRHYLDKEWGHYFSDCGLKTSIKEDPRHRRHKVSMKKGNHLTWDRQWKREVISGNSTGSAQVNGAPLTSHPCSSYTIGTLKISPLLKQEEGQSLTVWKREVISGNSTGSTQVNGAPLTSHPCSSYTIGTLKISPLLKQEEGQSLTVVYGDCGLKTSIKEDPRHRRHKVSMKKGNHLTWDRQWKREVISGNSTGSTQVNGAPLTSHPCSSYTIGTLKISPLLKQEEGQSLTVVYGVPKSLNIVELHEYEIVSYVLKSPVVEVTGVIIFNEENDKRVVESASNNNKVENALMMFLVAISWGAN
ncbi:unnamed protein product [Ilex paraguariensis]|uniref:Uncharacterized protein n=1 Tax=Ilex paraguariensis TaxID=185542 RepID=A0ABC8QV88_9AQUA